MFPPFREAEFDIIFGRGILRTGEILDLGVKIGLVEKTGSWYAYKDERIGQGRDNVINFLVENPDVSVDIEDQIRKKYGLMEEDEQPSEAP